MRLVTAFLALVVFTSSAPAQDAPDAVDAAAVERIIRSQLDAFNRDDGQAAWSHAAPGIQARFQTVEIFMEMVRTAYRPVYRSAAAEFVDLRATGDGRLVQDVVVTGQDGLSVLATYTLGLQDDGSWKIEGCILRELPELSV